MPIKCIEENASMPDLLKVTSLASMMVNSTPTGIVLEPLAMHTLCYSLKYRKIRGLTIAVH